MLWMRLLRLSSSSCCWCCRTLLLEETLSSCCSSWPMMEVCLSIRVWSCSFSSLTIFSSTCLCHLHLTHLLLQDAKESQTNSIVSFAPCFVLLVRRKLVSPHLFLLFSLLISFVWTISCFSNLLVDKEFSRSCRSSRVCMMNYLQIKEAPFQLSPWDTLRNNLSMHLENCTHVTPTLQLQTWCFLTEEYFNLKLVCLLHFNVWYTLSWPTSLHLILYNSPRNILHQCYDVNFLLKLNRESWIHGHFGGCRFWWRSTVLRWEQRCLLFDSPHSSTAPHITQLQKWYQ